MKKPRVKFNGGNPVALCDECSVITEYVTYNEDDSFTIRNTEKEVPLYCEKCSEIKAIEKAKAIIDADYASELTYTLEEGENEIYMVSEQSIPCRNCGR